MGHVGRKKNLNNQGIQTFNDYVARLTILLLLLLFYTPTTQQQNKQQSKQNQSSAG